MNKLILLICGAMFAFSIAGCNTTAGLGRDIEATGDKIEEVAEDTKDEISNDDS